MVVIQTKSVLLTTLDILVAPHVREARRKPNECTSLATYLELNRAWEAIDLYSAVARELVAS